MTESSSFDVSYPLRSWAEMAGSARTETVVKEFVDGE